MKQVPFKVMCFKQNSRHAITKEPMPGMLRVGSEYNVIKVRTIEEGCFYSLSEITRYCFNANLFATLPDPSEEVGIEQEQEALIYQR